MCIGSQTSVISRYTHPLQCISLRMATGVAEPCRRHTVCKILLYGYVNLLVSLQYLIGWMHGTELFKTVFFDILNVRGHNVCFFAVEVYCCRHVYHTTGVTILCFISFHMNTLKNSFYARDLVGYLAPQFMVYVSEILKLSIPFICSKIVFNITKCTYTIKIHILIITFSSTCFGAYCAIFKENFKCSKLLHFVITYARIFHTITLKTIVLGIQKTSPWRWRNKRRNMLENMW